MRRQARLVASVAITAGLFLTATVAHSQVSITQVDSQASSVSDDNGNAPPGESNGTVRVGEISRMASREFQLSLIILGFGALVLTAQVLLLRRVPCTAEELLRVFGVTLIVIGALMLVPAGFSDKTIAPAMGLLGTIAGYLLGQRSQQSGSGKTAQSVGASTPEGER